MTTETKPIGVILLDEVPHMIVFDDADREPLLFAGAGAREAALKTWEKISNSWNAHLFVRVERNSRDDRYPSATLATGQTPAVGGDANVRWDAVAKEQMQIIDGLKRELETITNDRDAEKRMKACARVQRDVQREIVILKCARIAELEKQSKDVALSSD